MSIEYKKYTSINHIKNVNRGIQRYKCKECESNFTNTKLRACPSKMKGSSSTLGK